MVLECAGRGCTTLMLADRLSTMPRVARMAAIDPCPTLADISYDALMHEGGLYADLARMQRAS